MSVELTDAREVDQVAKSAVIALEIGLKVPLPTDYQKRWIGVVRASTPKGLAAALEMIKASIDAAYPDKTGCKAMVIQKEGPTTSVNLDISS